MGDAPGEHGGRRRVAQAVIRRVFLGWLLIYLAIDLLPFLRSSEPMGFTGMLVVAAVLFWPWLLGALVLGVLYWLLT